MPVVATKTQQLLAAYEPILHDLTTPIDEFTLRRIVQEAERCLATAPGDECAALWGLVGMAHIRGGKIEKALKAFETAHRLAPHDSGFANNEANALAELGRHAEALQRLRKAREAPGVPPAMDFTLRLNESRVMVEVGDPGARFAYAELITRVRNALPNDYLLLAALAAELRLDSDAVEFLARYLAHHTDTDLGEIPAVEFVRTMPPERRAVFARTPTLHESLMRAFAEYDEAPQDSGLPVLPALSQEGWNRIRELVEHPREPSESLWRRAHERRS